MNKIIQEIIKREIAKLFSGYKARLIGPEHISSAIVFSVKNLESDSTIESIYTHANAAHTTSTSSIDKKVIEKLKSVAENYVDSLEQKTVADITRVVSDQLEEISHQAKIEGRPVTDILHSEAGQKVFKQLRLSLFEQKDKLDKAAELLATHELHNAQNFGSLDGILAAAKGLNIDDPVVFKRGIGDSKRCRHCWHLWTLDDKITPRLYKLSELQASPGHWKDPKPSIAPTHVNCRDQLSVLFPGFGLDSRGRVVYKGSNYDPIAYQRKS